MVFFPLDFVLRGFPVAEYFMYAAQGITQIDAEIAEKGHFWMETIKGE